MVFRMSPTATNDPAENFLNPWKSLVSSRWISQTNILKLAKFFHQIEAKGPKCLWHTDNAEKEMEFDRKQHTVEQVGFRNKHKKY